MFQNMVLSLIMWNTKKGDKNMTNRERKMQDIKVQLTALETLAPYGLTIAEKLREKEIEISAVISI